jgi:hypothetical protein
MTTNFFKSYLWLEFRTELSSNAKRVYGRLCRYGLYTQVIEVSQLRLQRDLAIKSNKSMTKYIQELVDHKLIRVEKRTFPETNRYYLLPHPEKWLKEFKEYQDSVKDTSVKDTSVKDTSVKDTSGKNTSVKNTPTPDSVKDTPPTPDSVKDTSVNNTPSVKDTSVNNTPSVKDTSVNNTPSVKDTSVNNTPSGCKKYTPPGVKNTGSGCKVYTQIRLEDRLEERDKRKIEDVGTDEHSSILKFPDSNSSDSDSKVSDENLLEHPNYHLIENLVLLRLKSSPAMRKPKWLNNSKEIPEAILVKKKRDMKNLLQWLKQNACGLEKEYLGLTVLQIDPKMMAKDMSFLTSPNPRRAWENFLEKVGDYPNEKIIEIVNWMLQLYTEYRNFKIETLKQQLPLKFFKIESHKDGDPTSKYPEFDHLVQPSIEFCMEGGIEPWQVIQKTHEKFSKLERDKGKEGDFIFTCAHIGTQTTYKPSLAELRAVKKKKVNPWDEIIKFLGLSPDVKIAKKGIPLGFSLSGYDATHGISMTDITEIDGNRYFLKNGTDHIARYYFSATDPFAFYITPENFHKFKDLWNVDKMPLPTYEELIENGKELTKEEYDTWKVNQEDGSTK